MLLILLPGMDGTGILFEPFLKALSPDIQVNVITYPVDTRLSYKELVLYVQQRLPENKDFILLAESFSGPIAYEIAKTGNKHLKLVVFSASFIRPPNKLLVIEKILPLKLMLSAGIPGFFLKILIGDFKNEYVYDLLERALDKVSNDVLAYRIFEMANLSKSVQGEISRSIYIQALNDKLVSLSNADTIKHISKEYRIYKIKSSHLILQVKPEKCAEIIANEISVLARQES